jgi:lipopolysaccharide export system protein LptC
MTVSRQFSAPPPAWHADRHRRQQAFQAARRHSRLVRRLRIALPVSGSLVIAGFVIVTRLSLPGNIVLSAARLSVTSNSIIMENPHMTGFDADKREYSVKADRAIQQLTNPDAVRLEQITATVKVAGQGTATITAGSGDYDNTESTLKLHGGIAVESSEGYALKMSDADIDLRGGTLASVNPVTISYQDSTTTGESISVSGGGQVIVLDGGVRTTLMPPKRAPVLEAQPAEE